MTDILQHALPAGTRIGIYEITRVRGAGPFGITYRAWNQHLNTQMALREYFPRDFAVRLEDGRTVAPKSEADQAMFRSGMSRFLEEADCLFRIEHPNLVCVHNTLEENGTAYVVMEYEEGVSLADLCDRSKSRLDEEELRVIFVPILEALEEVHGKGLVHGGIDPSNILVRRSGEPVLLDFAASRLAFSMRPDLLGTILSEGYAPAEQYDAGNQPSPQTDLYALGATMYHCVTGGLPPVAARERVSATQDEDPHSQRSAVEAAIPAYSATLLRTIDWLMSPRVADRPQAAADVLAALDTNVDEDVEGGARPEQKSESRWTSLLGPSGEQRFILIAGAGLLFAVLAVTGFWYLWKGEEQPQYADLTERKAPLPTTEHLDAAITSRAETESLPPGALDSDREPLPEPESMEAAEGDRRVVVAAFPPVATLEAKKSTAPSEREPDTPEPLPTGATARKVPNYMPEPARIGPQSDLDGTTGFSDYRADADASSFADSASARVATDHLSQGGPDPAAIRDSDSRAKTPEAWIAPRLDLTGQASPPRIKAQTPSRVRKQGLESATPATPPQPEEREPRGETPLIPPAASGSVSAAKTPAAPQFHDRQPRASASQTAIPQIPDTHPRQEIALASPAASGSASAADTSATPRFHELGPETDASQSTIPQTSAADPRQEVIERHMIAAEEDLAALHLTTPRGANAFEHYQAVLTLEPGHPGARKGLELIVDRYVWLIDNAINKSRFRLARVYLDRAEEISPEASDLRSMRAQLREADSVREKRQ